MVAMTVFCICHAPYILWHITHINWPFYLIIYILHNVLKFIFANCFFKTSDFGHQSRSVNSNETAVNDYRNKKNGQLWKNYISDCMFNYLPEYLHSLCFVTDVLAVKVRNNRSAQPWLRRHYLRSIVAVN